MTISDDHRREMMKKRLLGILLSFALMMVMLPVLGVSQTAYAVSYNLWVGGVQVTSEKTSGPGWSFSPASGSDPATLTLNGANITEGHTISPLSYGIYYVGEAPLNVVLQSGSVNTISGSDYCIYSGDRNSSLALSGGGTLNASSAGNYGCGVCAVGDLTINDCIVSVSMTGGNADGIRSEQGSITIKGGTVTASAADSSSYGIAAPAHIVEIDDCKLTAVGGQKAITGKVKNHIAGTGWTDTAGTAGKAKIGVSGETGQDLNYLKVRFPEYIEYPLWVRGTQVTSDNNIDVLGDGKVSYDPETGTLKLDGANITADKEHQHTGTGAAIYYEGQDKDLTINAAKASTVTATGEDSRGIYTKDKNLIFNGTLNVTGGYDGVDCNGNDITVNGKLTASGSEIGIYLDSGDITVNSGAELYASGSNNSGIGVNDNKGSINIKEGARVTAVGGKYGAISGIVKNAIAGTAWTDKDGTAGETAIEVNADRDLGDKYKKVQFPAEAPIVTQYTITYDLSGGTLDGQTGIVTKKVDAGAVITLPAPVRDGYTFDYWEGSRYNAGDKYTVTGDHTFTAVWKTGAGGDGKKGSGTKTGDENALAAWTLLMLAALGAATGMIYARKRKGE